MPTKWDECPKPDYVPLEWLGAIGEESDEELARLLVDEQDEAVQADEEEVQAVDCELVVEEQEVEEECNIAVEAEEVVGQIKEEEQGDQLEVEGMCADAEVAVAETVISEVCFRFPFCNIIELLSDLLSR